MVTKIGNGCGQCYTIPGRSMAKASDEVIIRIILIFYRYAFVLFELGSTFYYVSTYFASIFYVLYESFSMLLHVSTFIKDFLIVDWVYGSYVVTFVGCETWADLIVLDMVYFDVIFGMD